jgi:hypothetical protein
MPHTANLDGSDCRKDTTDSLDNPAHIWVFDVDIETGKVSYGKVLPTISSPAIATGRAATWQGEATTQAKTIDSQKSNRNTTNNAASSRTARFSLRLVHRSEKSQGAVIAAAACCTAFNASSIRLRTQ